MNTDINNGRELGWEDQIEKDSKPFVLLPEGDYEFKVVNFERKRFEGSTKLPPCNQAVLSLQIVLPNGESTTIEHSLFLHTITEGLLCQFFTCIGQRKHGEKVSMNWSKVIGATGRATVKIDQWDGKDGETRQSNKIKKFLEPEEPVAPAKAFEKGKF